MTDLCREVRIGGMTRCAGAAVGERYVNGCGAGVVVASLTVDNEGTYHISNKYASA